ncbi:MAG: PAS domain-containing protein [Deltaproteobacteria bacterium]|nr:MAG: PAS domain-containing protein [Deltaproteobacteria bacterium]
MSRSDWTPKIWAVQQRASADWRAQRAEEALPARAESATVLKNQDFSAFVDFLKRSCGFDFTGYKPTSLMRRVNKRMQEVGVESLSAYQDYLEGHSEEPARLFNTILINVTAFFRDSLAWNYLTDEVLPHIIAGKPADQPIRVWSVGCASGEEAYTLAILLAEALGIEQLQQRVKIYATDRDEQTLHQARRATYSAADLKPVPAQFRERYFQQVGNRYVVCSELRHSVIFGRHDLICDAPLSHLDLLVCRNTLMYFNAETQKKALVHFRFALNNRGFLFLGKAEALPLHSNPFTPQALGFHSYGKVPTPNIRDQALVLAQRVNTGAAPFRRRTHLRDAALDAMPGAQVVVDPTGVLLLTDKQACTLFGPKLKDVDRPSPDDAFFHWPVPLHSLIEQVVSKCDSIPLHNVKWTVPSGGTRYFDMLIVPLLEGEGLVGAGINFTDVTRFKMLQGRLLHFGQKLQAANQELQSANEQLRTASAALQTTSEALQATNKELQSTNAALETMHEGLLGTNETLLGFNTELHVRTDGLNTANAFLESILTGLHSAVVVVDPTLSIRAWNRRAEDLWGVRAEEVQGQCFLTLDIGLPVEHLEGPLRTVLTWEPAHLEVVLGATNRRGRALRCRVTCTALRDAQQEIQGAIMLMEEEKEAL